MDRMTGETFAEQAATGAKRKVDEFMSGVKDQAAKLKTKSLEDLWTGTVDYVRDNPGKTIVTSLVVGMVLGMMMRHRGE